MSWRLLKQRPSKRVVHLVFVHSVKKAGSSMANPILAVLNDQVTNATTVMASATILINGIAARVQAAVDAALANGASEAELVPVQAEVDALKSSSGDLAAAVQANTPAAPAAAVRK
jgi:hypothetical protein